MITSNDLELYKNGTIYEILCNDNLRYPYLATYGIDNRLYAYIENKIMPLYDDPSLKDNHDRYHIYKVLANAIMLFKDHFITDQIEHNWFSPISGIIKYPAQGDEDLMKAEIDSVFRLIYVATCFHDIGLNPDMVNKIKYEAFYNLNDLDTDIINDIIFNINDRDLRSTHHEVGYMLVKYYFKEALKGHQGFVESDIDIIANAILCHRASDMEHCPNQEIEKILCQADRCFYFTKPREVFKRAYSNRLVLNEGDKEEAKKQSIEHVREKYGENGYRYKKIEEYCFKYDNGFRDYRDIFKSILKRPDVIDSIYDELMSEEE